MLTDIDNLRHSLSAKVASLVIAILVLGFGGLMILNIQRESDSLITKYETTARLLANALTTSIQNGMLESRPDIIIRTVNDMKTRLKEVRRIELYRRNGVPAFTDMETALAVDKYTGLDPKLLEKISKMRAEPGPRITEPLFKLAVEKQTVFESYESLETGRVLTVYQPLKNLKECQECHNRDHNVRGVLRISLGLERLDAELREARKWQLAIALLTIFGVAVTIIALMSRMILHPIAKLMTIAKQIGAGDFNVRIHLRNRDEIGELGNAINEMAGHLNNAYGELQSEIAERKRAESVVTRSLEQIKAQAAELEVANKVKSEFLSVMSHELRTPLNVILGHTWLLRERAVGDISAPQDESLAGVEKQARLLLTMVNSILETTRIEAEACKIDKSAVSLERLFDDLRTSCAVLIHDQLKMTWDYPDDLPPIVTDRNKLYTAISNLIENAIKFTPQGVVAVSARIAMEREMFEVVVRDTGLGIAQKNLVSIFHMFHQIDSSDTRTYSGLGLGLYIVKKFTDLLGGTIEVTSTLGEGSVFTVRFPYEIAQPAVENGQPAKYDLPAWAFQPSPRR
jgi:signal transduction histidine kinase